MKKAIFAFIIIFAAAASVFADANTVNAPSQKTGETAAVSHAFLPRIITAADRKPIMIRDLKIDIEVVGNLSMTTYDIVFYNPNELITEGEFVIALADSQSISAVSLDINGKMRDGVTVVKRKANQSVESVPNPNINIAPALAEKPADNHQFKMKIYPFNPDGTRRVKITVEELLYAKDNKYIYKIPLRLGTKVNFDLNVEIPSEIVDGLPSVETDLPDFTFKKGNNVLKASFSQKEYMLNSHLSIALPRHNKEPVFTHKAGKKTYFYTDISVKPSSKNKVFPKNIAIIWNSSLSSGSRDIKRELALLDAYFKKVTNAEVAFTAFNITKSSTPKNYSIVKGNWDALKKDISRIVYDGASRFDKLNIEEIKADEILLFTDATSTFGNTRLSVGNVPVYAVNSSSEFNQGALESAALKSGGVFINLNSLKDKEASDLLTKQHLKLVSYSFDKNKINEVYPRAGGKVNENFTFAGILTVPEAEITLSFGYDKTDIVTSKKIMLRSMGDSPTIERLWAAQKIKALESDSGKNEKEIVKLAQKYSIATEFTSLLVLEKAVDYAAYKITPPKELLSEYNNIMSAIKKEEKNKESAALEDALLQTQDVKDWWKTNYSRTAAGESSENVKTTAFGVPQAEMFGGNMVPAASEGEVKAPSQQQEYTDYSVNKNITFDEVLYMNKAAGKKDKESIPENVKIKAWDPHAPYLKIIANSPDDEMYADYLKLKAGYGEQPSFYFDMADEFIRRKMKEEAVVVLSNIIEMKLDNPELLRITAYKFMEAQSYSYAVDIFEKIVKLRDEDPQYYRDLALAYQANKEYKKALSTFYKILTSDWERFQSIKQIVFVEMNNLISLRPDINLSGIDKKLVFPMPVDIRIVLGWSADDTDIDIYVKEPTGGLASYSNRFTGIGGRVSEDLTQGFGPEEYMLKKAVNGEYEVSTDYFGDDKQSISGPTVLYLDIYTFYGTKNQTHQRALVRTENVKENNVIGSVNFKNK